MESREEEIMHSRLSSLPEDIIYKILSTVPMKDVIKTSLLSSRWRYIWTSMPCLNFSTDDFRVPKYTKDIFPMFTQFVKHFMSRRNNQVPVSYVKLYICGDDSSREIEMIIKYILSHNVQQVDVELCLLYGTIPYPLELDLVDPDLVDPDLFDDPDLLLTPISSLSLKRLSLTMYSRKLIVSSTLELPALTTLYLRCVDLYRDDDTLFSKCPNLKNLTLKNCRMKGMDSLSICHYQLSNLTLEHDMNSVTDVNVVAPQLKNLTIRYRMEDKHYYSHDTTSYRDYLRKYKHVISAPNLISLLYEAYDLLPLSTDGFHCLEKVDLCICSASQEAAEALEIVRLFQQIQSVKFLTLNLEILELLSSYVQVISHHPPPFANLKSLDIYPKKVDVQAYPKDSVNISTEVKNYLLDSSQGATFTMVLRQEAQARFWMAELKRYLDKEKDIIETNRDHMQQPAVIDFDDNGESETQMQLKFRKTSKQFRFCGRDHRELFTRRDFIVEEIMYKLELIESALTKVPASNRAMLHPCFSSLCAETNMFVSKMTELIKIRVCENLSNDIDRFHELATSLQSAS